MKWLENSWVRWRDNPFSLKQKWDWVCEDGHAARGTPQTDRGVCDWSSRRPHPSEGSFGGRRDNPLSWRPKISALSQTSICGLVQKSMYSLHPQLPPAVHCCSHSSFSVVFARWHLPLFSLSFCQHIVSTSIPIIFVSVRLCDFSLVHATASLLVSNRVLLFVVQKCQTIPHWRPDYEVKKNALVINTMYEMYAGNYTCVVTYQSGGRTLNFTRVVTVKAVCKNPFISSVTPQ